MFSVAGTAGYGFFYLADQPQKSGKLGAMEGKYVDRLSRD